MHHNHARVNVILGLKGGLGSLSRLKFSHCLSTNVLYQWRNQRLVSIAKSPLGELERSNTSLSGINPEKSDSPIPKSDLSKRETNKQKGKKQGTYSRLGLCVFVISNILNW